MKRVAMLMTVMAVVALAATGWAAPKAERGLVKGEMHGEVGLGFQLDMSKGNSIGDIMNMPLYVRFVPVENLELGYYFPLILKHPVLGAADNGYGKIRVTYRFLKDEQMQLGVGAQLSLPKSNFGDAMSAQILVPFYYAPMKELGLWATLWLDMGAFGAIFDPATITLDLMAIYNIMPEVFVGGGFAFVLPTKNTGNAMTIPFNVQAGYTINDMFDVGLKFYADLYKKSAVFHRRGIEIFAAFLW